MTDPSQGSGRALIDRINLLVEQGLLADLRGSEVKVLICLLKHADASGEAFPGLKLLANYLKTTPKKVSGHIAGLRRAGFAEAIGETDLGGQKSHYRVLLPPRSNPEASQIRRRKRRGDIPQNRGDSESAISPKIVPKYPPKSGSNIPQKRVPLNKEEGLIKCHTEGLIISEPPAKPAESELFRDGGIATVETKTDEPTPEQIYRAYPRPVAKPHAIKAIDKALKKLSKQPEPAEGWPTWLLMTVRRYAESRRNEDPQYTPYPATWFNRERYLEDPKTWEPSRNGHKNGKRVDILNEGLVAKAEVI